MIRFSRTAVVATLAMLAGCGEPLAVENKNAADFERLLRTPADVEAFAGSQFQQIVSGTLGSTARVHTGFLTAAFENASTLANNGLGPRSGIPRESVGNSRGNPYAFENFADFRILSIVAKFSAIALARTGESGFTLGSAGDDQRLKAWTWFTYGVSLGYLSMVYDSVGIPRPGGGPDDPPPPFSGYRETNAAAIAALDSALKYATMTGTSALREGWLTGPGGSTVAAATFARVIRSYRARVRAGVARNPTERTAVNWNAVIADATNGIQSTFLANFNPSFGWDYTWLASTLHYRDSNWHQMTYYGIGMADTSGAFDLWLQQNRDQRTPFLIQTPDLRFPQGNTRDLQVANGQGAPTGRRYFRNRAPGGDQSGTGWQNSWYDHYRWRAFADAGRIGPFPLFTVAENDMLAAEGYIRTGNIAAAAALIDRTRTTAGLPPLTGAVTTASDPVPGGSGCVPRVPQPPTFTSTACGNILEAMKWEKRIEMAFTTYGGWYFDSRGWGDLPEGTPVSWPVPYQELDARAKPIYDLGGVGRPGGAGPSTYGYGSGSR